MQSAIKTSQGETIANNRSASALSGIVHTSRTVSLEEMESVIALEAQGISIDRDRIITSHHTTHQ